MYPRRRVEVRDGGALPGEVMRPQRRRGLGGTVRLRLAVMLWLHRLSSRPRRYYAPSA